MEITNLTLKSNDVYIVISSLFFENMYSPQCLYSGQITETISILLPMSDSENGQMCAIKEVRVVFDDHTSKECLKQLNQVILIFPKKIYT